MIRNNKWENLNSKASKRDMVKVGFVNLKKEKMIKRNNFLKSAILSSEKWLNCSTLLDHPTCSQTRLSCGILSWIQEDPKVSRNSHNVKLDFGEWAQHIYNESKAEGKSQRLNKWKCVQIISPQFSHTLWNLG